jgi:uroporphyrinogen-III synthase
VATTWLITRETEGPPSWPNSVLVPCLETKLLAWPWNSLPLPAERGEGRGEGLTSLTLFTSRRAVASWAAAGCPTLGTIAALSPATTSALQHEGVTAAIASDSGAVGLAKAIERWWLEQGRPALHLRYPTSDAGITSDEQQEALRILTALGTVDRRVVYLVAPPAQLRQSLERAARGDWSISFASPSAIQHFFAAQPVIERAPTLVACRGASTERAWNELRPESWPPAVNESDVFPEEKP